MPALFSRLILFDLAGAFLSCSNLRVYFLWGLRLRLRLRRVYDLRLGLKELSWMMDLLLELTWFVLSLFLSKFCDPTPCTFSCCWPWLLSPPLPACLSSTLSFPLSILFWICCINLSFSFPFILSLSFSFDGRYLFFLKLNLTELCKLEALWLLW